MQVQPFSPNLPTHSWPFLPRQVLCILAPLCSCLLVVSYWPFCSFLDAWNAPSRLRNASVINARFVFMNKNKNWGWWRFLCKNTQTLGNPEFTLLSSSALPHYLLIFVLVVCHRFLCSIPRFMSLYLTHTHTVTQGHQPPCVAAGPVAVPVLSLLAENVGLVKLIWIHKGTLQEEGWGRVRRMRREVKSFRGIIGEKG